MSGPRILKARDTQTGDIVSFKWNDTNDPTDADLDQIFTEHRAQSQTPAAAAPSNQPAVMTTGQALAYPAGRNALADLGEMATGAGKRLLDSVTTGGNLLRKVPGIKQLDEMIGSVPLPQSSVTPSGTGQEIGAAIEKQAENIAPAMRGATAATALTRNAPAIFRLGAQMLAGAGTNAATSATHGSDTPGRDAMIGAAGPAVGAAALGTGRFLASKALPLAQSALKTPLAILRSAPGAAREGTDAMSRRIANTALDNRLFSAADATEGIDTVMGQAEAKIAEAGRRGVTTDAATRSDRYLAALGRGAGKNPTSAGTTAENTVAAERQALRDRSFGEDVQTGVRQVPSPSGLLGPNGQPLTTTQPVIERQLRPSVPIQESRQAALAMSRYSPAKWGGTQNVSEEASKAVQRGTRDAVKSAVPRGSELDTRPEFAQAQRLIKTREALRIMHVRDASRDTMTLPASAGVVAAGATGRPLAAIIGFASQLLKNNQLRAGIYARDLERAIANNDAQTVGRILQKLGISTTTQMVDGK